MNRTNRSVPCELAGSIYFNFFFKTASKRRRCGVLSLQPPKSKPSLLPLQQLPPAVGGCYKMTTLFVVTSFSLPNSPSWRWKPALETLSCRWKPGNHPDRLVPSLPVVNIPHPLVACKPPTPFLVGYSCNVVSFSNKKLCLSSLIFFFLGVQLIW